MKHLARRLVFGVAGAVDPVSHDGMAGGREVNPDLMRASRLEPRQHEARPRKPLERPKVRDRPPPRLAGTRDAPAPAGFPHEVGVVGALVGRVSGDDRDVLALDGVLAKARLEKVQGGAVSGEGHRARGLLVDPMQDARVGPSPVAMLQVEEDAAPERVLFAGLGRHGQQAGRLVHDHDVVVLVQDGEARADAAPGGPARVQLERCLGIDLGPGLVHGRPARIDPAGAHGIACRPTRQPELAGDGEVEPHGESPSPAESGTRTSTKKCGSPMRASGLAPGP